MPTVFGQLQDVSLVPTAGQVTLRLVTSAEGLRPPGFLSGGVTVLTDATLDVDAGGDWALDLVSNFDPGLSPAGTYYSVTQQARGESARGFAIQVPYGGGPYPVTSLVVDPPADMPFDPGGLAAHIFAHPAHAADQISVEPSGTIASTDVQSALVEIALESVFLGSFVWSSSGPQAVWGPVLHGLGYIPQWSVIDTAGDWWEPTATLLTNQLITLDFNGIPVNGNMYLS